MGVRGPGVSALFFLISAFLLSACIELKSGIVVKSGPSLNAIKNCPLPNSNQVAQVARSLATAAPITPEVCLDHSHFECYRRVFSPTAKDGKRDEQECTHLSELGGDFCLSLPVHYYDTRAAASRPDTEAAALLPGGDYNRSEYVCHQKQLRDQDVVLASGLGESLKEALFNAHQECTGVAPRVSALQGAAK